jgi:hypothetical protein
VPFANSWKLDRRNAWTFVYAFADKEIKAKSQQSITSRAGGIKYPREKTVDQANGTGKSTAEGEK